MQSQRNYLDKLCRMDIVNCAERAFCVLAKQLEIDERIFPGSLMRVDISDITFTAYNHEYLLWKCITPHLPKDLWKYYVRRLIIAVNKTFVYVHKCKSSITSFHEHKDKMDTLGFKYGQDTVGFWDVIHTLEINREHPYYCNRDNYKNSTETTYRDLVSCINKHNPKNSVVEIHALEINKNFLLPYDIKQQRHKRPKWNCYITFDKKVCISSPTVDILDYTLRLYPEFKIGDIIELDNSYEL